MIKKSTSIWMSVTIQAWGAAMTPCEALEKEVLTEESTLLLQACQDPYGKRK